LQNNTHVNASMAGMQSCTPLVKKAVELSRSEAVSSNGQNGTHGVETLNDIATLLAYEKHIRILVKKQKKDQQQTVSAPKATVTAASHTVHQAVAKPKLPEAKSSISAKITESKATPKIAEHKPTASISIQGGPN